MAIHMRFEQFRRKHLRAATVTHRRLVSRVFVVNIVNCRCFVVTTASILSLSCRLIYRSLLRLYSNRYASSSCGLMTGASR